MIASDNNSDLYCKGIEVFQDAIGLVDGKRWEPNIMLDHDATIAAAWHKLKAKGRWNGEVCASTSNNFDNFPVDTLYVSL